MFLTLLAMGGLTVAEDVATATEEKIPRLAEIKAHGVLSNWGKPILPMDWLSDELNYPKGERSLVVDPKDKYEAPYSPAKVAAFLINDTD